MLVITPICSFVYIQSSSPYNLTTLSFFTFAFILSCLFIYLFIYLFILLFKRFDLAETEFDTQPTLSLLPKLLTIPIDTIIGICTTGLSESNKDLMVSLLAESASDELINYISLTTFRFPGALKFEELSRSVTSIFMRASSAPIRGKFSRLREILLGMLFRVV